MIKFFKSMLFVLTVCIFAFLIGINVAKAVSNATVITINSTTNQSITVGQTISSSTDEKEFNNANVELYMVQAENNGFSSDSMRVTVSASSGSDNQEQSTKTIIEENIDDRIDETLNKDTVKTTESKTSSSLATKKTETIDNEEDQTKKENDDNEILALNTLEPLIGASSTQKAAERNWWIPIIIAFLVLVAAYYGYIALVGTQNRKDSEISLAKKTFLKENQVLRKPFVNEVKKKEESKTKIEKTTEMSEKEDTQEIKPIDEEDKTRW